MRSEFCEVRVASEAILISRDIRVTGLRALRRELELKLVGAGNATS